VVPQRTPADPDLVSDLVAFPGAVSVAVPVKFLGVLTAGLVRFPATPLGPASPEPASPEPASPKPALLRSASWLRTAASSLRSARPPPPLSTMSAAVGKQAGSL
jgi:hypothetical protein